MQEKPDSELVSNVKADSSVGFKNQDDKKKPASSLMKPTAVGCLGAFLVVFLFVGLGFISEMRLIVIPWPVYLVSLIIIIWLGVFASSKKNTKIIGLGCLGFVLAIGLGIGVYALATPPTISTDSSDINIQEYMPFNPNSKLVNLPNPASLQLSEPLPRIDGATALVPVYMAFVNAVYPKNTSIDTPNSPVQFRNTIFGYNALADGESDIMFAAYPSAEQMSRSNYSASKMEFTPIGREGFVFIVNEANPINSLSSQQIKDIYSGKITNWNQVGGENVPIEAYQRNEGSGSQSAFLRFMGMQKVMKPPTTEVRVMQSMESAITKVASDYKNSRGAIGFSFRYFTQEMMKDYPVKILEVDNIAPTLENITNDTYPLSSEFYAVTNTVNKDEENKRQANVKSFIEWILSDEGQYIISKTGYAPLKSSN
jgi:phosphate transport system substrate-binding protein